MSADLFENESSPLPRLPDFEARGTNRPSRVRARDEVIAREQWCGTESSARTAEINTTAWCAPRVWEAERELHGMQPLPAREAETRLCGLHPLPPRQAETRLRGLQPLPAREAETRLRGVHPLPSRQMEKELREVQPLPSRQGEKELRRVQPLPSWRGEKALARRAAPALTAS